jgi:hypothetical protein
VWLGEKAAPSGPKSSPFSSTGVSARLIAGLEGRAALSAQLRTTPPKPEKDSRNELQFDPQSSTVIDRLWL